jgi:hypothetical protein
MEGWQIALVLKPLVALILLGLVVLPIKLALQRYWPDGPVKRFLFKRRG